MSDLVRLARRLRQPPSRRGLAGVAPLRLDLPAWCVPPAWLDALQDDFDATCRQDISRLVLAGIVSADIHGERAFIAAARDRLARPAPSPHAEHLEHLAHEEERHARAFEAIAASLGGVHPARLLALGAPPRPDEDARALASDALLFGRLLVFEEIVDSLDLALSRDARVARAVREVHAAHHADEARHLAFGRTAAGDLVTRCEQREGAEQASAVRRELAAFAAASWRAFFTPEAFRRAGHPQPVFARDAMIAAPALAGLHARLVRERFGNLVRRGVLPEEVLA